MSREEWTRYKCDMICDRSGGQHQPGQQDHAGHIEYETWSNTTSNGLGNKHVGVEPDDNPMLRYRVALPTVKRRVEKGIDGGW